MEELMRFDKVNKSFNKKGSFLSKEKKIHVLKDIDLTINEGEIIAVVGESGCGKTTLGKLITGLYKPSKGEIFYMGKSLKGYLTKKINSYQSVQFIQQDSYAALNPVRTIYQSLYAPIKAKNHKWTSQQINDKIEELMNLIGLVPSSQFLTKYPHQLSGGQRQRILMARAISLDPKLIVADEPVSMIDVSLRISILKLMTELNKKFNVSFIYITHDLSTARYIAQNGKICVMYLGEIMEMGNVEDLLSHPLHPYTKALIKAVPVPDPKKNNTEDLPLKSMDLANIEDRQEGCSFYARCLYATDKCKNKVPYVEKNGVIVKCCNLENVK